MKTSQLKHLYVLYTEKYQWKRRLQLHVLLLHINHLHAVYQKYTRENIYLYFTHNDLHIASGIDLGYSIVIRHVRI